MRKIVSDRNGFFKKAFASLVVFLGTSFVFSVQYWGDGVFADFGFSVKSTLPTEVPYEGTLGIRKSVDRASFEGLFNVDDFSFNGALSYQGIPLKTKSISLGYRYLTHVSRSFVSEDNPDLVTWVNYFLLTTSFDLGNYKENPFRIGASFGVYVGKSYLQLTRNKFISQDASMTFEFKIMKRFLSRHEIMFRWASFDALHYREFVDFWWQLGYSYDLTNKLTLGVLAEVLYSDQVFLSGAISGYQAKLCAVYKL